MDDLKKTFIETVLIKPNFRWYSDNEGISFVLAYLLKYNEKNILSGDLSNALNVSTARMAVILKKMENRGYVYRYKDLMDNRKTIVSLTKYGKEEAISRFNERSKELDMLLAYLGEDDTREFIRIFNKIKDCFRKKDRNV